MTNTFGIRHIDSSHLVALSTVPGWGSGSMRKLLKLKLKIPFEWDKFWKNSSNLWTQLGITQNQQQSILEWRKSNSVDSIHKKIRDSGNEVILLGDQLYPKLLREIDDPPVVLFVKNAGNLVNLTMPIAVVGTRRNTEYGKQATQKIVRDLVYRNAQIISGGMYGIDLLAHQASVESGGQTVVVLGYGSDHVYPRQLSRYYSDFLEQGVVFLSEYPPDTVPNPGMFPQRNRIVAGMSYGTVVVEAAQKSGSHITAQCALDYGRSVGAVPGSIFSKYSDGTKSLHKQGAVMVSRGQDVIDEIEPQLSSIDSDITSFSSEQLSLIPVEKSQQDKNEKVTKIVRLLSKQKMCIEQLSKELEIDIPELGSELSLLEVEGRIRRVGMYWQGK